MEVLTHAIDFILHVDEYLEDIINNYGLWTYLILFVIIFCETGLVVTPFLPGDSLLFAAGALTARTDLQPVTLFLLLAAAAIIGDSVNYSIGKCVGPRIFSGEHVRFLNKKHLDRTHEFYEKHGGKTIILARFIPIIRTFAPFVAGIGKMTYGKFISYNIWGGMAWVALLVFAGYYFGGLKAVEKNFSQVVLVIIFLSILPPVLEVVKHRAQSAGISKAGSDE